MAVGRGVLAVGETLLFVGFASRITSIEPAGREAEYTRSDPSPCSPPSASVPSSASGSCAAANGETAFITGAGLCLADGLAAFVLVKPDAGLQDRRLLRGRRPMRARGRAPAGGAELPPGALPSGAVLGLIIAAYFALERLHRPARRRLGMSKRRRDLPALQRDHAHRPARRRDRPRAHRARHAPCGSPPQGSPVVSSSRRCGVGRRVYLGTVVLAIGLAFAYPALTALTLRANGPRSAPRCCRRSPCSSRSAPGSPGSPSVRSRGLRAAVAFGVGAACSSAALRGDDARVALDRTAIGTGRRRAMIGR